MEFKFDVTDLGVILSALKKYDSPMSREIWDRLKQQYTYQKNIVASVAKDSADDGPEVDLIQYFRWWPGRFYTPATACLPRACCMPCCGTPAGTRMWKDDAKKWELSI